MLPIDLKGKRVFVAGVGDDDGYGWAIAKAMHQAGASVCVGTWPPVMTLFTKSLERGKFADLDALSRRHAQLRKGLSVRCRLRHGRRRAAGNPRRQALQGTQRLTPVQECADKIRADFGEKPLDAVVHSLANGPEVKKPLLETSRKGYLAAVSASAYSYVSMIQRFAPLLKPNGFVRLPDVPRVGGR